MRLQILTDIDDDMLSSFDITKKQINSKISVHDVIKPGDSVILFTNKLIVSNTQGHVGIGVVFNKNGNICDCLYKGFLLQDCLNISTTVKENYIETYVYKEFLKYKEYIKQLMPRVKKLKRLNLKLLNKEQVNYIYQNFDDIFKGYQRMLGYEKAMMFKASFVTTPFYILDNGHIKIYNFENNEITEASYEGANFFCYFTMQLK